MWFRVSNFSYLGMHSALVRAAADLIDFDFTVADHDIYALGHDLVYDRNIQ